LILLLLLLPMLELQRLLLLVRKPLQSS
jgi:hypothetical protein